MSVARTATMLLVSAALTAAIGFGSRAAYTTRTAETAVLRLSWRLRGEKHETCRQRSEAELEKLPAHMRTPQECTVVLASYRLILEIDDERPDTLMFIPAGAKGDRPVFVLHDRILTPGEHEIEVEFEPVGLHEKRQRKLEYEGEFEAVAGRIHLLTLSQDRRLVLNP